MIIINFKYLFIKSQDWLSMQSITIETFVNTNSKLCAHMV